MRIHEEVVIAVSPERAWDLIADVEMHSRWNHHIVDTQNISQGESLGSRYRITYELNDRRTEMDAEIVGFSPPRRFVVRLEERQKGSGVHFTRHMIETYTIQPHARGIRVQHDVLVHDPGIPWFFRALIWFIQKTGRPVGKTIMQRFAEVVNEPHAEPLRKSA